MKYVLLKLARVVKLKLAFMECFFLQFGNTNEVTQNSIPKFRQSSVISEKPGFDELQLPQSLIFFAEILHTFPT